MYQNEHFYPIMLNYSINLFRDSNEFVIVPFRDYEILDKFENHSKIEIQNQILGHFKLIKEMGFNTIRICTDSNFGMEIENNKFTYRVYSNDTSTLWLDAIDYSEAYFIAIEQFLEIAELHDIKIMILLRAPFNKKAEKFTKLFLQKFSNNPTIFAYDFMNEPLYFDNVDLKDRNREKVDAYNIVARWKIMMEKFAPYQLLTIGFSEPIEVLEWDPSVLPVDFVQFHTYHPLRVPSEIYWYANYVNKPWMIGETSLPADNDSVFYEEQVQYMKECYKMVLDCGGSGFGWWGFQDMMWGGFEHDYTSLLNRKGTTTTTDSLHTVVGTLKPAAMELNKLRNYKANYECIVPVNYYNMVGYNNVALTGKIINKKTNEPIEGAVIRGWSKYFGIGANTFTDENGNFTLYSNMEFVNFQFSAPGMTRVILQAEAEYQPINGYSYPMDSMPNMELEYHKISFIPFLRDRIKDENEKIETDNYIFNFRSSDFNEAKFTGSLGTLELEPLKLKKPGFFKKISI
jgi:hypothetical protein